MAVDHGSEGIRVNCILPGPVYTPMVYQEGMSDKLREVRKDASLLNIEGNGYDIGRAVVYLCSCLLYTSPSPRDMRRSRMPSSA